MDVIVCYKIVPEEQDIAIKADRTLSFDKVEWKLGQYDLPAVEAGVQLVETAGGKVTAVSVGNKQLDNSKFKKAILSRGPEEACLVVDDLLTDADAFQTAQSLAKTISKKGAFDLVICGEGSSDLYAQQVGSQLGELLNVPAMNGISKITPGDGKITVERTLEEEVEILEIPLPAVISVTTDSYQPRIPSMKEILAAGKKPVTQWTLTDIAVSTEQPTQIISTLAPPKADRKQIMVEGDSEDNINIFLEHLRKEL
ncbi:electron transfer flavoprotein [Desulfitobacterium chlororespirans]|uniref:Electron transfer flavoprotein small subunit n=1 Tax=Desulfitobacterium chlororespirans DSM 11544 TaxID=1121395 RepID=A0A1M7UZB9_9FIRM|nr:electron transfer flavoprotein [Desulfitobacterium chlororespirans]SHN88267.1 electron transfer flavoprotein beta subunit [Desulfitobacterium chlororespirans DSM 11544]